MKPGFEGGIDIRQEDKTRNGSVNLIARNGEVHLTVTVEAQYGMATVVLDLTANEAHELSGAFRDAAAGAGPAEIVEPRRSVSQDNWTPDDTAYVLGHGAARGHVLGERG